MSEQPVAIPLYGPCAPEVRTVLARAASLDALEIIGLAQAREIYSEPDLWNTAIDVMASTAESCGRQATLQAAAAEAHRLTWQAATTATQLPDMARPHLVNHRAAFRTATEAAGRLAAVAAMSAVLADRLSPTVSAVLCAPWRQVTEIATPNHEVLS